MFPQSFIAASLFSDLKKSPSTLFPTKELTNSSISTSNPITVIFGTAGANLIGVPRISSSRRQSYMSIYDNTMEESVSALTLNPSPKFDAKILNTSSQPISQQYNNVARNLNIKNEQGIKRITLREGFMPITNMFVLKFMFDNN